MNLSDRDRRILNHVARYHLTFHEVVSWLFFEGGDPRKTLARLEKHGMLAKLGGLGSARKAYRLDRGASGIVGASRRRMQEPAPTTLQFDFAVYGFCFLRGRSRIRLKPEELKSLYGSAPSGRCHVLERSTKGVRVYDVQVPGPKAKASTVVETLVENVARACEAKHLLNFIRHRLYGNAILIDNRERREEIKRQIDAALGPDKRRLRQCAFIAVEIVPGFDELTEAFNELGPAKRTEAPA